MPVPILLSMKVIRTNVVRATFDRQPRAVDPAGYNDATNPANWTATRATAGYIPRIARVSPANDPNFVAVRSAKTISNIPVTRHAFGACTLLDGRMFACGGATDATGTATTKDVEIFDPSTALWTKRADMPTTLFIHAAVTLADGTVLVFGGITLSGQASNLATWRYDPVADVWNVVGSLPAGMTYVTALRLLSGKVLAVGTSAGGANQHVATFDPATNVWTAQALPATTTGRGSLVMLASGKALLAGGDDNSGGAALAVTSIFDPVALTWVAGPSLGTARTFAPAITLTDGRVIITGGTNGRSSTTALQSAEVLDAAQVGWTALPNMITARYGHALGLNSDNTVIVPGGNAANVPIVKTETFSPVANNFTAAGDLPEAHGNKVDAYAEYGLYKLSSGPGSLLVAGYTSGGLVTGIVESYNESARTWGSGYNFVSAAPNANSVDLWFVTPLDRAVAFDIVPSTRILT